MKTAVKAALVAAPVLFAGSAFGQSYSLSGDWTGTTNPNGPWTYGYLTGSTFTSLGTAVNGYYGYSNNVNFAGPFIYKNTGVAAGYGIDPGQVSLEADFGTPDVRFTVPVAGVYSLNLAVGGATGYENGGYGNADASKAALVVNGTAVPATGAANNVYSWALTQPLAAGSIVDVYVGQGYGAGNTQTAFTLSVPEPASLAVLAAGSVALASRRRRRQAGGGSFGPTGPT